MRLTQYRIGCPVERELCVAVRLTPAENGG